MKMDMKSFLTGPLAVNCYVVFDEDSRDCLIIDPGGQAAAIEAFLQEEKLHPVCILNTHGHGDHIGAVDELRDMTGVPFFIHAADAPMLLDAKKNLSAFMGFALKTRPADGFLQDGQRIACGAGEFQVIHTPGHSSGGICLYGAGWLFSGDSLFAGSIGRCDFPGASELQLVSALKKKIAVLPPATLVYPGHGESTTLKRELASNPYLRN